jgi:hypothetical protein
MDQSEPARRRRTTAIIAAAGLACVAIAIPVSGAFADGDSSGNTSGTAPAQNQQYGPAAYGQQGQQQAPPRQGAPDGNCPKDKQGSGQSNGGQGNNNNSSGAGLPGDTVAS